MEAWDPHRYLRFADERTRPSVDLASRIAIERPSTVVDLGCGPGNSTRVLRSRWPLARVVGVDNSAEMIDAARAQKPDAAWIVSGIEDWSPGSAFDVVFSNATLQWLPDHGALIGRLFGHVADDGALAFQIPSADFALVYSLIREIALHDPWAARMTAAAATFTMQAPGFYYDLLAPSARALDMWTTRYYHVLDSPGAVVDWIASTGLRPFLDALESQGERESFVERLHERVAQCYRPQRDGRVLFPFERLFVVAYR
jgi:trans-aconitate 2-methyltransferase